ncbi:MAG: toll/interleukin-1 receptor domain-containing protein [Ilumatobacter sp.]|nr:toll/interleukin-1 receptor domain-containing protein [Ilumatobacter sp.]
MADVFVSYSHEDRDSAREVVCAFQNAGFMVDWDNRLVSGERYNETIPSRISHAQQVVVLWSKESSTSDWVKREAGIAAKLRTIAPLRLDDSDLPPAFDVFHTPVWAGGIDAEALRNFVDDVGARARRQAAAAAYVANDVRRAFHARRVGDFERATDHLEWALRRFEVMLDDVEGEELRDAIRYKARTLRALDAMASRDFCGRLMRTLAGESLLPVIDAVLELRTDAITARLRQHDCDLKRAYRRRKIVRAGIVIRPGSGVDDAALVEKLLSESGRRHGPLQVDCFLLIMRTTENARKAQFSRHATARNLDANCLVWRPEDGDDELEQRLLDTARKVCEDVSSEEVLQ